MACPEQRAARSHVQRVPILCSCSPIRDDEVPPEDGRRVEVPQEAVPRRSSAHEIDGRGDTSHDVRDERSEAEGEEGDPLGELDGLGLIGELDDRS